MIKNFKEIITNSAEETIQLGRKFAQEAMGGEIFCLKGDLGSGKTTFSQGFLRGVGVDGAITSPTFVVMKHYSVKNNPMGLKNVYHIDTYRVDSLAILDLGWEEVINNKEKIILVEWPEKIKDIIPLNAVWINFESIDEKKRKISIIQNKK